MNYFMYSTIVSVFIIFLANQSEGQQAKPFPETYKQFITSECPEDLDVYKPNANGQWPAKVIKSKFNLPTTSIVRLDITWTADITNVKGFKIVLKPSGMPDICRILDYTDVIGSYPPGMYSFKFTFNRIYSNKKWQAKLYPLPSRDNTSEEIRFDTSTDCSSFAPDFSHDYDGKYMKVTLTQGPAFCKFELYKISVLYPNNTIFTNKNVTAQADVDKVTAFFELNVCKGYYSLLVSVNDIYSNDRSRCVCKRRNACVGCVHSSSKNFYIVPAKSCSPENVTAKSVEPDKNKLLFPLGVVIGLLFLIVLVLYISLRKLSVHLMVRKRGIVLFLDDHEHHTNAVTKVVDYLNEYHLKVYLASTFLKNTDIPDQMVVISEVLKSDFILLVLSPALQKRMEAWDKQQDYVEFFKQKNSNILNKAFLEFLLQSNKLFVCKFDHAAEFWPKPCYSLPSDLTRMAAELSGQSFSQRLILCNCLKSNALRRELQIAIKKTIMYEQSYSNWFSKKYVCPTQFFSEEPSQSGSIGQYEFLNPQKLNEIFTGYKDTSISLPEENATAPSIYSVPISEKLEQINITHL